MDEVWRVVLCAVGGFALIFSLLAFGWLMIFLGSLVDRRREEALRKQREEENDD